MTDHQFVFIGGLHRSGTSLVHEILRGSPVATGFVGTGFPQDEGQFLQTVYPRASVFGGPGKFGFDPASHMDEHHPLATPEQAEKLFTEWSAHWDMSKRFLLEKSPPNIVRLRYFQALYPESRFIVILRHPLAVAYATRKWSGTTIPELLEHSILCYERFLADMPQLRHVAVFRYEEFVQRPQPVIDEITDWLGMPRILITHQVRTDVNANYFETYRSEASSLVQRLRPSFSRMPEKFEPRANALGYSIVAPETLHPVPWLGFHG
jgi:hypothetical protein